MARILVLSDDPDTREQVLEAVRREHDVCAYSSEWRGPLRDEPDVLIVDALQVFSPLVASLGIGSEAQRRAAAQTTQLTVRTRAPAIVCLIAPGEERQIIPCFEAGADDYSLSRPVDARDLKAKIDRILAQRLGIFPADATDRFAISDDGRILASPQEDTEEIHAQLGRYEVGGILGRGGYGVVYRAKDLVLQREVALKLLPKDMHDNAEAVTRFFRESTAIARLNDPNIVKFYELGAFQSRYYFTMELVEGRTLKEVAELRGPMPCREAAWYVAGIAKALRALESLGLVHRDVKPENVIVTPEHQVKLIDFGLVRISDTAAITSQDDVLGTPYFMAPEYIKAPGVPDIRYDLYACGVTLFHLLTGEYPFDGKNAAHVMEAHVRTPPPRARDYNPEIPPLADALVDRLLQKDPERRIQSPSELLKHLRPLVREE